MTTDILKDWLRDLPMQFLGKKNIEVLIKAFARQMQELDTVFDELNSKTDLDTAIGQNLDYVGTIIPLTRKEAGELAGLNTSLPVISDERYRKYLQYKMLQNTSECTYDDIMKAIEILWDVSRCSYYERQDRPATIFIGLNPIDVEEEDPAKGKPDILKPAGVGFFYTAQYSMAVDESALETVRLMCLDMYVSLYFFKRILNGDWLLDGSVILDQIPICKITMSISVGTVNVFHEGEVCFPSLYISAVFPMVSPSTRYIVEAGYCFDSSGILNVSKENIGVNIPVHMDAGVSVESVIIEKDLWCLDGQVLLDGSRILDAEIWKERL